MLSNDSTRFRKACIFTTQKTLRENTCTIASGDYSTPVSQRRMQGNFDSTTFVLSDGVACNTQARKCTVAKFSDQVDTAHTRALFGR